MIEAAKFFPLYRRMTRLASRRAPVCPLCHHLFTELTGMGVRMACRTGAIVEVEFHWNCGGLRLLLVALDTRHCEMAARQRETRLLVTG